MVADEVRKLAESSQRAAKQIAGLIAMIQQDTQTVVAGIQSGGEEVRSGTSIPQMEFSHQLLNKSKKKK